MQELAEGYRILNRAEERLGDGDIVGLDDLSRTLSEFRSHLGPGWMEFTREHLAAHPIRRKLHESPFARRAFEKPRGYAGDAVTIDYVYGLNPVDDLSNFGRALYEWEYHSSSCRSVRTRREIVASRIDDVARSTRDARILSVACGHLREADISAVVRDGAFGEFLALDQDAESLAVIQARHPSIKTVCGNVQAILTGELAWSGLDLVYAAGLYDYLGDAFARRLTARLFDMLRPGGRLLIANFHPESPGTVYMEAWMDWWLICRSEDEMKDLARRISPGAISLLDTFRDADGNIAYLELVKA